MSYVRNSSWPCNRFLSSTETAKLKGPYIKIKDLYRRRLGSQLSALGASVGERRSPQVCFIRRNGPNEFKENVWNLRPGSAVVSIPCQTQQKHSRRTASELNFLIEFDKELSKLCRATRLWDGRDSNVVLLTCQTKFLNYSNDFGRIAIP